MSVGTGGDGRAPVALRERRRAVAWGVLATGLLAAGCQSSGEPGGLDLERMVRQPRVDPYEASTVFADGKGMQAPPAGTVPWGGRPDAAVTTGRRGGAAVERIPVPVDRALLERGRERFGVYCAPCHGFTGNGGTPIAGAMTLRPPPSLHAPALVAHSDGALFDVVTGGYGLMPGYAMQLPPRERWAVVAYVRALQLSGNVPLAALPEAERTRLLARLPAEAP